MAAVVSNDHLFFIGSGTLWVADLSRPTEPAVVGRVHFGGTGRQIAIQDDVAYVTARADGLYIIDVADPTAPRLLSHYDTLELATGVDVHGPILCIAERQYGVELVDVSSPSKPAFISKVRTGEAQSVAIDGRHVYAGDWMASQVTTIDIANPREPHIVSRVALDGYGDGVTVQGSYLYASTGHHARGGGFLRGPDEPGYGAGHGLEVLSLADPAHPEVVTGVKFPALFRRGAYDTWTSVASGDYVFCADSENGVFAVDVADPEEPRVAARYEELVGGLAVGDGTIYAACPERGYVAVLDARGMAQRAAPDRGPAVRIPPAPASRPQGYRVYRPGGQIRAIDFVGDAYALVAAGMQGVHVLRLWPEVREVSRIATRGFALHLDVRGSRVYVSEGRRGLSIWEHAGSGHFEARGRYEAPQGQPIRQALAAGQDRYAVAESANRFFVIDVSDPDDPRLALERKVGIVYGDQTSHGLVAGRYVCVSDHLTPMRWLDLQADSAHGIDTGVDLADTLNWVEGAVAVGDRLLVTSEGGYRLAQPLSTDLEATPLYRCHKSLRGKPWVYGASLYLVSRIHARIAIVDISRIETPQLLHELKTEGNPNAAVVRNGALLIPDSYNGLIIYDDFVTTFGLEPHAKVLLA
jgi:hypothetical protein